MALSGKVSRRDSNTQTWIQRVPIVSMASCFLLLALVGHSLDPSIDDASNRTSCTPLLFATLSSILSFVICITASI